MRVSVATYKHSALATVCSVFGTIFLVTGLYCVINTQFVAGVVFFALGALLLVLAPKVNAWAEKKKLKKALEDPKLIQSIQKSAIVAYSVFEQMASVSAMQFLEQHNPGAAFFIAAKYAGRMTEEELIGKLREMDAISGQQTNDADLGAFVGSKNGIFKLEKVYTLEEQCKQKQVELAVQEKRSKTWLRVCGVLFLMALIGVIFCGLRTTSTWENREAKPTYKARTGSYTQLEMTRFKKCAGESGYIYGEAEYLLETVRFRFPESEKAQFRAEFRVSENGWCYSEEPVSIYGVVREIDGQVILDGSFEQEQVKKLHAPMPWTILALFLLLGSGICLVVFGRKYLQAKKGLESVGKSGYLE